MSQALQYKGYEGAISTVPTTRCFTDTSLASATLVIYDGIDIPTLETNFKGAVDKYLEFCRVEGRTPNTPFKGSFNVRIG